MPWFLLKEGVINFLPGDNVASLPADYLKEDDDGVLTYREQDDTGEFGGEALTRKLFPEQLAKARIGGLDIGICEEIGYSVISTNVVIYPAATNIGELSMLYYGAEPPITETNQTNRWSTYAPELLIAATGRKLATYIRDTELAQLFAGDAEIESTRLIMTSNERKYSNIPMVIV